MKGEQRSISLWGLIKFKLSTIFLLALWTLRTAYLREVRFEFGMVLTRVSLGMETWIEIGWRTCVPPVTTLE